MYRSLLVPLDGSPFGEQALPLALGIARQAAAALELAHVIAPLAPAYADTWPGYESTFNPALKRRGRAYLDAAVRRLQPETGADVPVAGTLLEGIVPEALAAHVLASRTDLVVMTTHGRGPLARAWLGSVADALVRRLTVPVLLVRPDREAPVPVPRHVLIPLDGSPLAEQAIEPAVGLGSLLGAEYTLFRVIPPLLPGNWAPGYPTAAGYEGLLEQLERLHAQELTEAETYLERVAQGLRERGLHAVTRVAVHEQPAVAILEEAKAHPDGIVAVATHGRGGLPRLFLGSVADKVLRGSSTPVLLQRAVPAPQAPRVKHRASVTVV
jgi:nucleotide-binding universal stress UspA family protein